MNILKLIFIVIKICCICFIVYGAFLFLFALFTDLFDMFFDTDAGTELFYDTI